jgi:hypothetical protein
VLLHDNRLLRVSPQSGEIDRVVEIGPPRPGRPLRGALLALSADSALALVGDRVVALDPVTLERTASHPLEPGVRYAGLAVAASGTIYAYGDRRTRDGWWQVVVTRVRGGSRRTAVVRGAEPARGVYWGAIGAGERRLLLTYHGGPDGADWFRVSRHGFERCEPPHRRVDLRRNPRCLWSATADDGRHVHGAVAPYGKGFIAATGHSRLIALAGGGRLTDVWDPRTADAHLMNFALDAAQTRVVTGSCEGLGIVDLRSRRVRVVPRRHDCEESPLAVHGDRALLARDETLEVVDLERRETVARTTVPAAPIAAVVAG